MRSRIQRQALWGTAAALWLMLPGCSTTAYTQYQQASLAYSQCQARAAKTGVSCTFERDQLDQATRDYREEAEKNQWWVPPFEDYRDREPLSVFDRK